MPLAATTEGRSMNYQKAFAAITRQVFPGETMLWQQPVDYEFANETFLKGAFVLTDRRIIYVGSFLMERADFSIPISSITSIDSDRALILTYTLITAGNIVHRFVGLHPQIINTINQLRSGGYVPTAAPGAPVPAAPAAAPAAATAPAPAAPEPALSTADELGKLASLHAAGDLTDAEFSAAKARLLS
jgi:hypothetical protein